MTFKKIALHPFLFAIYPVLFLYSYNIEQLTFDQILFPLFLVLVVATFLFYVLSFIFKNHHKAGLIVSFSLLLFFSYGYVFKTFEFIFVGGVKIGRIRNVLALFVFIFFAGVYAILRTRSDLVSFTKIINFVGVVLMGLVFLNLGIFCVQSVFDTDDTDSPLLNKVFSEEKPDIYYIVLDAYDNNTTLKDVFGFDNQEFLQGLKEKDFYIVDKSVSNYAWTFLSLASILNMEYVNYFTEIAGEDSKNLAIAYKKIRSNKVAEFLTSNGYKYIHLRSGWGPTDFNDSSDIDIQCGKFNEFTMILFQTTLLDVFDRYFNFIGDDKRKTILCTFSKLSEIHKTKGPKFVFAHILVPHPPFVFGAEGEAVEQESDGSDRNGWDIWRESGKDLYIEQLKFVNRNVEEFIEKTLSSSETNSVVILQSDHGTAFTGDLNETTEEDLLKERLRNFTAFYVSDKDYAFLEDFETSVNTFRVLFNKYFKTDYSVLEDKSYYSTGEKPYLFTDVTELVSLPLDSN